MSRRIKEFIEVKDYHSLDALITQLVEIRDQLPGGAEAEMRMRGDDVFGRKLTISYFRQQTAEEAECDARYAEAHRHAVEVQEDEAAQGWRHGRPGLRAVA